MQLSERVFLIKKRQSDIEEGVNSSRSPHQVGKVIPRLRYIKHPTTVHIENENRSKMNELARHKNKLQASGFRQKLKETGEFEENRIFRVKRRNDVVMDQMNVCTSTIRHSKNRIHSITSKYILPTNDNVWEMEQEDGDVIIEKQRDDNVALKSSENSLPVSGNKSKSDSYLSGKRPTDKSIWSGTRHESVEYQNVEDVNTLEVRKCMDLSASLSLDRIKYNSATIGGDMGGDFEQTIDKEKSYDIKLEEQYLNGGHDYELG